MVMLAVVPYWPAVQFEHTPAPSKLYVPAGHSVQVVFPPGENWPAGQEIQLDCRVSRLYCPVRCTVQHQIADSNAHHSRVLRHHASLSEQ